MPGSVIVSGARTPIGKLSGALAPLSAAELGGVAIAAALERAGLAPDQVDYVLMGQVLQAGQGQITARQAAVAAGIPMTVPATTVNKVCLSGLHAIYLADLMVGAGDADVVVAGGMESMTRAPHLLAGAREGFRLGDARLVDSMMHDGLTCAFDDCAMGLATERYNERTGIGRARQDAFAAASHEKAAAAAKDGRLAEETVAVTVPQRKGDPLVVDADEGVRPGTTAEALAAPRLRPRRDHHRRQRLADLRRSSGRGRHVPGAGTGARGGAPRGARLLRAGGGAGPLAPPAALPRDRPGPRQGGPRAARGGPVRDQRGVRRGGARLRRRARDPRGPAERERRGHRARPPDRDVGHPSGAHRPLRAAAPRGRHGRRGALWRRRAGRRRRAEVTGLSRRAGAVGPPGHVILRR